MMTTAIPVIELAQNLIEQTSVTPDDGNCQAIFAARLQALGFHCEHLSFGSVKNLYARLGNQGPLFVFAGHTDVVPPGPTSEWTSPPFSPEIRDGILYGRGAVDMKGALAAMLCATEQFLQSNPNINGSIAFLLTSDEEGPSTDGTRKVIEVLKNRSEQIDYCLIGEPSSEKLVGDQIRVGRRGSLHGKLRIQGKQGHVAHPHLAINPIHLSALALHELVQTTWDEGNQHFPPTTFQISNVHSGTGASNVIPGHLECLFNLRHGTASSVKDLQQRIESLLAEHELDYEIEWEIGADPFLTQHGSLLNATQQAIQEITGLNTRLSTGGGTSDGRFIAPTGAEVIELGVSHATAHHINECVPVNDLVALTAIYARVLDLILSK